MLRGKGIYIECKEKKKHTSPRYKLQEHDMVFYREDMVVDKKEGKESAQLKKQQKQGFMRSYWQYEFF